MTPEQPAIGPDELLLGMHEAHRRVGAATARTFDLSTRVYALAELLVRKGVIGLDELDRVRDEVEERMDKTYADERLDVQLAPDPDKYALDGDAVDIDCESRLPLCRAACCRLRFALSEQDIHEGVVQWSLTEPYLNRQTPDGYCVHANEETRHCDVYEHRPAVCRRFDCRGDTRIWLDFDNRIINPDLFADDPVAEPAATRRLPLVEVR